MKEFWDYLIDSFVNLITPVLIDIKELFIDIIFYFAEQVMAAMAWVIDLVKETLPEMDTSGYWSQAPDQLLQVLTYLDFHVCIALVTAAIGIRFILNFIPFIR